MTHSVDGAARLRTLFEAALERTPRARAQLLDEVAHTDAQLHAEVLALLEAHAMPDEGLFARAMTEGIDMLDPPTPSRIGQVVGVHRITREIGRGGMGVVYEAERADGAFAQRVAIKVLTGTVADSALRSRFRRERQILATLAHPNIAALHDAGLTDERVPYLVLEHVDGVPLDVYCATHRLGLSERLDLFAQVLAAVQHAHARLIVHRDLKPGNILVTAEGVVKLLDFGISSLLRPDGETTGAPAGVSEDEPTTLRHRAFTTAYAAPEQVRGEAISTATDVYALGLVLFRLLAGRPPFDLTNRAPGDVMRIICESAPPPPSALATAEAAAAMRLGDERRLARALRGELDAIVLMALRKEPERRYGSVEALAADLRRFLRGRPVRARPDTVSYRVHKLVQRNRTASAALVFAVVALMAGTGVAIEKARQTRRQAALAADEHRAALRVSAFLQEIFTSADPSYAGLGMPASATLVDMVDLAAARMDELADDPDVAEPLHRILASTYATMAAVDRGTVHAREVMRLLRARRAPGIEYARGLHDLGRLHYLAGRWDSAAALLTEAHALHAAAGFSPSLDLVRTLDQLGVIVWDRGDPDSAEVHFRHALAVAESLPANAGVVGVAMSRIGMTRQTIGDLQGAERWLRRADSTFVAAGDREFHEHGTALHGLALLALLREDPVEAEARMREAIAIWHRTLGPSHVFLGLGAVDLARAQAAQGRLAEALSTFEQTAQLFSHLDADHPAMARRQSHLAAVLLGLGRLPDAEQLARRALATRRGIYPPGDWRTGEVEITLGRILLASGASEPGMALLASGRNALIVAFGPDHPRTRLVLGESATMTESSP